MKSFAIAALLSCIATANVQKEHASLAQLMMLHDEMVAKIDEPNNDVDANKGLFDRLTGDDPADQYQEPNNDADANKSWIDRLTGDDPEDQYQPTVVDIAVDVKTEAPVSQKLQPRFD